MPRPLEPGSARSRYRRRVFWQIGSGFGGSIQRRGRHGDCLGPARARERRPIRPQAGRDQACKLDPHRAYLLALIDETPDLTISELLERLAGERSVTVSRSTLWEYLARCRLTFKKRPRTRASRPAPTSPNGAKTGSKDNSISTPNGLSSSTRPG